SGGVRIGPNILTNERPDSKMVFLAAFGGAGDCLWAKKLGHGAVGVFEPSIAIDLAGNVFVMGKFVGRARFGETDLAAEPEDSTNGFILKCDSSGRIVWVRQLK